MRESSLAIARQAREEALAGRINSVLTPEYRAEYEREMARISALRAHHIRERWDALFPQQIEEYTHMNASLRVANVRPHMPISGKALANYTSSIPRSAGSYAAYGVYMGAIRPALIYGLAAYLMSEPPPHVRDDSDESGYNIRRWLSLAQEDIQARSDYMFDVLTHGESDAARREARDLHAALRRQFANILNATVPNTSPVVAAAACDNALIMQERNGLAAMYPQVSFRVTDGHDVDASDIVMGGVRVLPTPRMAALHCVPVAQYNRVTPRFFTPSGIVLHPDAALFRDWLNRFANRRTETLCALTVLDAIFTESLYPGYMGMSPELRKSLPISFGAVLQSLPQLRSLLAFAHVHPHGSSIFNEQITTNINTMNHGKQDQFLRAITAMLGGDIASILTRDAVLASVENVVTYAVAACSFFANIGRRHQWATTRDVAMPVYNAIHVPAHGVIPRWVTDIHCSTLTPDFQHRTPDNERDIVERDQPALYREIATQTLLA